MKGGKFYINGIYGDVTHCDIALNENGEEKYYKSRHNSMEQDENGKLINMTDEKSGLPLELTEEEYFKMALLQIMQETNKTIRIIGEELKKLNTKMNDNIISIDNVTFPNINDTKDMENTIKNFSNTIKNIVK